MWCLYTYGHASGSLRCSEKSEDLSIGWYTGLFRKPESIENPPFYGLSHLCVPLKTLLIFLWAPDVERHWGSIGTCPGVLCSYVCGQGIDQKHTAAAKAEAAFKEMVMWRRKLGCPWAWWRLVSMAEEWSRFSDNQQPPKLPSAWSFCLLLLMGLQNTFYERISFRKKNLL